MNAFNIFRKKQRPVAGDREEAGRTETPGSPLREDYLARAAQAGHEAKAAVKAKEFDKAWGLYHEQKSLYLRHAQRCNFTKHQILALDSEVHENLANILRLEGKHEDAFIHILYWVIAQAQRPIKRHEQKLAAYFKRCKYENTDMEEVLRFTRSDIATPDYLAARSKVAEWSARG